MSAPTPKDVAFVDSAAQSIGAAGLGNITAHKTGEGADGVILSRRSPEGAKRGEGSPATSAETHPHGEPKVVGFIMPPKDADAPNSLKVAPPIRFQQDAPSCSDCGSIMVRNGACYKCLNCGSTSGCS